MTGDETPEKELTGSSDPGNSHQDAPTVVDGQNLGADDSQPDPWAASSSESSHEDEIVSEASDLDEEDLAAYAADEDEDDADLASSKATGKASGPSIEDNAMPSYMEPTVKMSRPKDFLEFASVEVSGETNSYEEQEKATDQSTPADSAPPPVSTTPSVKEVDKTESGELNRRRGRPSEENSEPRPTNPNYRRPTNPELKPGEGRPSGVRRVRPPRAAAPRKQAVRAELPPALIQTLQSFASRVQSLESNTQKIARALVEIVKEGDNRKKAYDVLYGEMRQYKENFLWQAQKPLFMDLIKLFDSMLRVQRKYEAIDEMDEVAEDFVYLKEVLLETLYRYDIELIEEHPEKLDISIQKPVKRIDCDNPEEDRTVVQYIREGFTRDGLVLRPQEIVVKRYVEGKE